MPWILLIRDAGSLETRWEDSLPPVITFPPKHPGEAEEVLLQDEGASKALGRPVYL